MPNTLLNIQQARILYKGQQAFDSLNFDWEEGQQWAITGDSGWLLTAFLETLRGNTVVSSGEIIRPFANDYILRKTREKEIHSFRDLMAYVSQRYEFRNKFNQQNFYFQQRFNSSESEETATVSEFLSGIEPKISGGWTLEKVIDLMNLGHLRDESLLKLSNGETRRLALGSGLLKQPKIYLMDQPMTGLDVESRSGFGEILKKLIQEGVHVILTTSAGEIPEGITHVAHLHTGGIEQTWEKNKFNQAGNFTREKSWNWELLESLLPKEPNRTEIPVRLENVRISYDGKAILDGVNWQINTGEHWQLKGLNGSGKSTLISLLIGENPQSYSQSIWLFGKKRGTGESIWDVKRPTGFVAPELARFFPANQTCRKVILSGLFDTMGLFKKVTQEQEELANQWIQLFELENLADLPLSRLSLEHQRWTLLARALIKKPELLILDEASQGMDELQRRLYRATVQKICELSPVTLIYVSHYTEDIPEAVDIVFQL